MFNRKDGKRVKNIDVIHKVMPHLMNHRCDAEVYISESVDITNLLKFLNKKNKDSTKEYRYTLFQAFLMGIAKTVKERPLLNRFIAGRKYYDRKFISLSFIAKSKFADEAPEILTIIKAQDNDTLESINKKILEVVSAGRAKEGADIDKILNVLTSGPVFLTKFIVWIVKCLDSLGLLPTSFTDGDPNYTTVLLTNLGSIKCNQVYHHLNNYGTNSILVAIGTMYQKEVEVNGKKILRDFVDVGVTCDERIADGFYFAKSINLFKEIIDKPEILDEELKVCSNIEV